MRMAPSGPHPSLISRKQDHNHLTYLYLYCVHRLNFVVQYQRAKERLVLASRSEW